MTGWRLEVAERSAAFVGGGAIGFVLAYFAGFVGVWPVGVIAMGALAAVVLPQRSDQ